MKYITLIDEKQNVYTIYTQKKLQLMQIPTYTQYNRTTNQHFESFITNKLYKIQQNNYIILKTNCSVIILFS